MGAYKERDLDFIIRTRKILKQYDALFSNVEVKDYYNVTLFINCCIGLIIIPRQELNQEIPREIINEDKHGISPDSITLIRENVKQFNFIVSHIRNSISHNHFHMDGRDNKIETILFEDYLPGQNGIQTFKAEISFEAFKKFALFLSKVYVGKMAKKLQYTDINAYMEKFYPDDLHNH